MKVFLTFCSYKLSQHQSPRPRAHACRVHEYDETVCDKPMAGIIKRLVLQRGEGTFNICFRPAQLAQLLNVNQSKQIIF